MKPSGLGYPHRRTSVGAATDGRREDDHKAISRALVADAVTIPAAPAEAAADSEPPGVPDTGTPEAFPLIPPGLKDLSFTDVLTYDSRETNHTEGIRT